MGFLGGGISKAAADDRYLTIDASIPRLVIKNGAPGETDIPEFVGEMYLDPQNHKAYIADATTAYTDYKVLN